MNDGIGIGIIGVGFARATQIPAFLACERARVIAIASGHRANAERTAQEFGIGFHTDDWRELIARDDIHLVSVAAPPNLHKEMAIAALEAGKAVLCEKPMAMNAEESAAMSRAAHDGGLPALIDHELRFLDCRRVMRRMIREGVIGLVHHASVVERRDSRADPLRPWNWWSDVEQGGGELGALGSHALDSLLWLLDAEITGVFALLTTHVAERLDPKSNRQRAVTSDDSARMLLQFRGGACSDESTGIVSLSAVDPGQPEHRVEVFGADGALMVNAIGELYHARSGGKEWRIVETAHEPAAPGMADTEWARGFTLFSRMIVDALARGRHTVDGAATFDDGHRTQLVIDAARQSHAQGMWMVPG